MIALLAACTDAPLDPPGTPVTVVEHGPVTCDDPERRLRGPWDHVVLPGPAADEDRFWGAGVVAADLDGDEDVDLFLPGPDRLRLFRQVDGELVEDPGAVPGGELPRVVGAAAADVDADGDLDLAVTRFGFPDLLLRNEGGRFADAEDPVVSGPSLHSQSPAFADLDRDGDLDLVIAGHGLVEVEGDQVVVPGPGDPTRVLLREDGGFSDRSDLVPEYAHGAYTYVASVVTLDHDRRPDLLLADDYPAWRSGLALRQGEDGAFALAPELGLDLVGAGMGVAAEDANGDGLDDFVIPVWDDVVLLSSNDDVGRWIDATRASGARLHAHDGAWVAWGAEWVDLDLDGDLDLVVASGHLTAEAERTAWGIPAENEADQTYTVLLRDEDRFVEATEAFDLGQAGTWRGFAVADLNDDGWPDLARRDLRGETWVDLSRCGEEAWLAVRPLPPSRAVGAKVVVRSGDRRFTRTIRAGGTSLASGGPPEARFGLDDLDGVDEVEVWWPDGAVQRTGALSTRQRVDVIREE